MEIKGTIDIGGIKRCYVDGAVIKVKCPGCGGELECGFVGDNYLSYPEVGKEANAWFFCGACEEAGKEVYEWEIPIKIVSAEMVIEYDPDLIKPA